MSTRVSRPNGRFLSNVVFLGLAASIVAGCSESTSRFDNLFTSSTKSPKRIDDNQTYLPKAELPRSGLKRFQSPGSDDRNEALFNAGNVTREARTEGFRNYETAAHSGIQQQQQQLGIHQFHQSQQSNNQSSISRQALPPLQGTVPQATYQAPQPSISQQNQLANQNGSPLSLEQARQLNNAEGAKPLLERQPQQQALLDTARNQVAPAQQFNQGTAWTRNYSPVPTSSPVPKAANLPSTSGPSGYTPPKAAIDGVSTSSVTPSVSQPKVIRSSVNGQQRPQVDQQRVASVSNAATGGWTATNGTFITLQNGETLYSISRRYGVPVKAISRVNNISDPTRVRSGQKVLIPTYVASSDAPISQAAVSKPQRPIAAQAQTAPTTIKANAGNTLSGAPQGGVYIVQKGDTLTRIAARNNISLTSLRSANDLHSSDNIRIGQRLNIGGQATASHVAQLPRLDKNTTASVTNYAPSKVSKTEGLRQVSPDKTAIKGALGPQVRSPIAKPKGATNATRIVQNKPSTRSYTPPKVDPIKTATTKKVEQKPQVIDSKFIWPARGEVISRFGSTHNGEKNDGINLNVPVGTPVRASASGEVIYASNGLADYGNLVLIRHSNGFVTAYAHNSTLSVKRGERVRQGQVIAKSGKTGGVKKPQLHFELRKGKKPVDPLNHLSG